MFDLMKLSDGECREMFALRIMDSYGVLQNPLPRLKTKRKERLGVQRISADAVLNEAVRYAKPSAFSRAVTFEIADVTVLLISGTASVDENGATVHAGDFNAQLWRTFRNISELLDGNDMTWHHVVRTSCYLRDIERDYEAFNQIRTRFFTWLGLHPLPASTGIQAILCRPDLLVEIEAVALCRTVEVR